LKKILLYISCLALLAGSAAAQGRPDKSKLPPLPHPNQEQQQFVPGEVLVKFRINFTARDRAKFNTQVNSSVVSRQEAKAAFHAFFKTETKNRMLLRGWELVKLEKGKSVSAAVNEMSKNALVEKIEPNGMVYAAALSTTYTPNGAFNDTYYIDGFTEWWINRSRGDAAKDAGIFFGGSSDVVVAVLDTGADSDHPELSTRLVAGWNFVAGNSNTDDDNVWIGTRLIQGHGTHAAGMIAAIADNSMGIAGTAWDARIKIMPVKVLDQETNGTFANIADGIVWATNNGADIISMSFTTSTDSSLISTAVSYADTNGVLMVAAAGNENLNLSTSPRYPACYASVLSVGATDSLDFVTYYSNYSDPYNADYLACVAPGGALEQYHILFPEDNGVTSTARTGGWSAVDGTSFAAPQVAALAALIKLEWPVMTVSEIKTRILNNCDSVDAGDSRYIGSGRINLARALVDYPTPTITPTLTHSPTNTPTFTVTPTFTHSPTITPTPSITPTSTYTPTFTHTPTITPNFTITPTLTHSPTSTVTPTSTPLSYGRNEFQAFPQPGRNFVRVAFNFSGSGKVSLQLYNAIGERVLQLEDQPADRGGFAIIEILTQQLGQGVYYLKLKVEDAFGARLITGKIAIVK